MKNKEELANDLRQKLSRVVNDVNKSEDKFPLEIGLLQVLVDLEIEMRNIIPNKTKLEEGAFGIFRLITESYSFQKSHLGNEMLSLHKNIKQFVKDFY